MELNRRFVLTLTAVLLISGACLAQAAPTPESGMKAYDAGDYDGAYDIFAALFRDDPRNIQVNYGLGLAAVAKGKLSHALFAFERVLEVEPDNMRARLETARIYFTLKQYELARSEFERVSAGNPPANVQENIRLFLEAMDKAEKKGSFSIRLDLRAVYDDNLNFGPSSATVDTLLGELTVVGDSRPLDAWGLNTGIDGGGIYDFGQRGGWMGTAEGGASQDFYDGAPAQEITTMQVGAGLRRLGQMTLMDLPVRFMTLDYGHDDLVDIVGLYPAAVVFATSQFHVIGRLNLEDRNYQDSDLRDSEYVQLAGTLRRLVSNGRLTISVNGALFDENSDGDAFQNDGWSTGVSADLKVTDTFMAYAAAQYRRSEYGAVLYPDLQDRPREDDQWQFIAGLRKDITKIWSVDLNHRHIDNSSAFDLYDYEKNVTTLTTSLTF